MADNTSSATAPALAYAVCSLLVKDASTFPKEVTASVQRNGVQREQKVSAGDSYFTEKGGRNGQRGAHSQDDQRQFPARGEADDEGGDEGGVRLDQQPHLVTDALLDLVDVAEVGKKKQTSHHLLLRV